MALTSIYDHFKIKHGSKVWPSGDSDDSPDDTYTCKHCGESESIQIYGSFSRWNENPWDALRNKLRDHLLVCEKFRKR